MYSLSDLIKCDIPMMSYIIFLGNNLLWLKIFEIIQLGYLGHAWSLLVLVWISTLYFIDVNFEPCFSHTKHTFIQKLELHYYQAKIHCISFFCRLYSSLSMFMCTPRGGTEEANRPPLGNLWKPKNKTAADKLWPKNMGVPSLSLCQRLGMPLCLLNANLT